MPSIKRFLRRDVLVSVPLIGGLMTFFSSAFGQVTDDDDIPKSDTPQGGSPDNQSISLEALQAEIRELQTRLEETDSQVSRLSQFDSPVGSVLGYLGPIPSDEAARWDWERRTGWLVCDGRPLSSKPEFKELESVLGVTHLPDIRGRFLRGVDIPAEGKLADLDEEKNRVVGTPQGYSTAKPAVTNFVSDTQPGHFHDGLWHAPPDNINPQTGWTSEGNWVHAWRSDGPGANADEKYRNSPLGPLPALSGFRQMNRIPDSKSGEHSHAISSGGDPETRPVNVAVFWIIKASTRGLSNVAAASPNA